MSTETYLDLKSTINLPKTDFPQKGNLTQSEPLRLKQWQDIGIYNLIRQTRRGRPLFNLHDGPPYANGKIHLGTALNKILKDFIVKSRAMMGYDTPYIPGYDCHGLPIEIQVDKELGARRAGMSLLDIRREARAFAERYIKLMNEDFQRLGVFGQWDNPYKTMDYLYEADTLRVLGRFIEDGSVYRGLKPVYWCIFDQTALAEAEVEYENHRSPSVYVKFPLVSDAAQIDQSLAGKQVYIIIWTTTPWTLPANLGIAFNPHFEYSAVEVDDEVYIVATELLEEVAGKCGWGETKTLVKFKGEILDRLVARHPFINRDSLLMLGDTVTLEAGTGCVHTAPGHGHDDYVMGQTYGLETYCPVDNRGVFTQEVEHFAGMQVFKANTEIVNLMRERGVLLASEEIEHSYPHCWRCHNPVIFRATPQWFISMDKTGLRDKALKAIDEVDWIPAWGQERMRNMFAGRLDWCISRQRAWGVPITVFYCGSCGAELVSTEVIEYIAKIFEREGADAWYSREVEYLLPPGTKCAGCGGTNFTKEMDILDVWLDSGASWITMKRAGYPIPTDVYIEGSDQYRGWFNSSLVVCLQLEGTSPYRTCITHGYTVDAQGEKMSKSKGNVVEPQEVIKRSGADILRLWASSVDYREDVRISDEILNRLTEAYRKIRNTARYMLGNLAGFEPCVDTVDLEEMFEIDRWAMASTNELVKRAIESYQKYEFHTLYHALYNFCTVELSAIYFDILKDRLYTFPPKSLGRRSAQTALYQIVDKLTRLMAPILAFTADEIWQRIPAGAGGKLESVHLAEFPGYDEKLRDEDLLARWDKLFKVRERVKKALEEAGLGGGSSLQAKVTLTANGEQHELLKRYEDQLRFIFIVSQTELLQSASGQLQIQVSRAEGVKCERCWNYTTDVGADERYPSICARCTKNVEEGWAN